MKWTTTTSISKDQLFHFLLQEDEAVKVGQTRTKTTGGISEKNRSNGFQSYEKEKENKEIGGCSQEEFHGK